MTLVVAILYRLQELFILYAWDELFVKLSETIKFDNLVLPFMEWKIFNIDENNAALSEGVNRLNDASALTQRFINTWSLYRDICESDANIFVVKSSCIVELALIPFGELPAVVYSWWLIYDPRSLFKMCYCICAKLYTIFSVWLSTWSFFYYCSYYYYNSYYKVMCVLPCIVSFHELYVDGHLSGLDSDPSDAFFADAFVYAISFAYKVEMVAIWNVRAIDIQYSIIFIIIYTLCVSDCYMLRAVCFMY